MLLSPSAAATAAAMDYGALPLVLPLLHHYRIHTAPVPRKSSARKEHQKSGRHQTDKGQHPRGSAGGVSRDRHPAAADRGIRAIDEDASEDGSGMTFHGYQRVDSDPTLSDNPRAELLNGNDDFASTYHAGIDLDESSFDEIERRELEDHLGEIPDTFHRRQRRGSCITNLICPTALDSEDIMALKCDNK
ncbi:hypothetical protein Y032_0003g1520 [Ancylostoma ceylanicum]|uniref:Uncharacterized protein n=2 Tax=Ancylostoma ceylanicum TaxID=53326 RepID=A0A016VZ60_9BILA|nr:hypothetical protein Y032_0003g1520 [Ancylostoma ceylanicum]